MTREIKFRAWNGKGMIVSGRTDIKYYIEASTGRICWLERYERDDWGMASTNQWKLMQYTGLKDKNGADIYEGDIVKFHYFYQSLGANMGVEESEEEIAGEVFHDEFGWAITKIRGRHWEDLTGYEAAEGKSYLVHLYNMDGQTHEESFEVIGNIYEHPHLLEAAS